MIVSSEEDEPAPAGAITRARAKEMIKGMQQLAEKAEEEVLERVWNVYMEASTDAMEDIRKLIATQITETIQLVLPQQIALIRSSLGRTLLRTRLSYELGGMLDVGGYDVGLRARTDAADDGEGV
ncbi:unnamed protein product [Cochlearia groenlandica]